MASIFLMALLAGIFTALVAGMISGIIIGKEALGLEMASSMGGLYGVLGGTAASLVGLLVLTVIQGA
ncbi:hypothetical protein [Parasphingorhabdus sp.]|uniref:hypothetical protein n=1 Tax=Parasphingorhabdus sp. TaxID=2709688 RepID=UPI003BAFA252